MKGGRDSIQDTRRRQWAEHNSLKDKKPRINIFPEGSWGELIPESSVACTDPFCRGLERQLRQKLYTYYELRVDQPLESELTVKKIIAPFDWGLEEKRRYTDDDRGAYHLEPVLLDEGDLVKIKTPRVLYREGETMEMCGRLEKLVGHILPVKLR